MNTDHIPMADEACGDCARAYAAAVARLATYEDMWRQQCEQARVAREERDAAQADATAAHQLACAAGLERDGWEERFVELEKSVLDLAHPNCRMLLAERDAWRACAEKLEFAVRADIGCKIIEALSEFDRLKKVST